jgi:hypothetical protein
MAGSRTYPGPQGVQASLVPEAGYNENVIITYRGPNDLAPLV